MANYSFSTGNNLPEIPADKTFSDSNFTQATPNTVIFDGVSGLIFDNCNLINCKVPADATLISCNNTQIDFCSHLHQKWFAKGFLQECAVNCRHLISATEIEIDGVVIDTIREYADKGVE